MIYAALIATVLRIDLDEHKGRLRVLYGVFNLDNRQVGLPRLVSGLASWQTRLCAPPEGQAQLTELVAQRAGSSFTR